MSIKPIDMQTNIAQMHEVARNAQVKSEAVVEQQHVLDKESLERSRLATRGSRRIRRPRRTPSCPRRRGTPAVGPTVDARRGAVKGKRRIRLRRMRR